MFSKQLLQCLQHLQIWISPKHLIWVWIMKVKGPKNQVDFIEVLYVVLNGPPKDERI